MYPVKMKITQLKITTKLIKFNSKTCASVSSDTWIIRNIGGTIELASIIPISTIANIGVFFWCWCWQGFFLLLILLLLEFGMFDKLDKTYNQLHKTYKKARNDIFPHKSAWGNWNLSHFCCGKQICYIILA